MAEKKIALKSVVTYLGIIYFRTQETVTKPNGSSHSLGGTSDEVLNRSPKGNTWSAIPVALLCMIVNRNERQGSGPDGDEVL